MSIAAGIILSSCSAAKKIPYVQEAETIPAELLLETRTAADPRIVPGDLVSILVTSTNMSAALPFNKGIMVDEDGKVQMVNPMMNQTGNDVNVTSTNSYLVNSEGYIDFPIVGRIHVGGLTKNELIEKIQHEIWPKYMKEKPVVDARVVNFRVTILGEVKSPGIVRAPNERMNLFEALALAGDLDIRGRRDNVLLIRTNYDGSREIVRLDLQDKNLLLSPYFQLQQNDQIYIEPNSSAANASWQLAPGFSAGMTIFGGISSVASLVIGIVNLSK